MHTVRRSTFTAATLILSMWALASPARTQTPAPPAQRVDYAGKTVFTTYCASCHGSAGKGDGLLANSFRKRPTDLTQLSALNNGTFPSERVTKTIEDGSKPHGAGDMPGWKDVFSRSSQDNDAESVRRKLDSLVRYIQTLQARPAADSAAPVAPGAGTR